MRRARDVREARERSSWWAAGVAGLGTAALLVAFLVHALTPEGRLVSSFVDPGEQGSSAEADRGRVPDRLPGTGQAPPRASEPPRAAASHLSPGEPSVEDVQAWDWLEQDCEQLLALTDRDARDRLGPDRFREDFVAATIEFLELNDEATGRFRAGVDSALAEIAAGRERLEGAQADAEDWASRYAAGWDRFRTAQKAAVRHVLEALDERPRHQLLREEPLKWLLRLDYGMRAAAR